MINNCLLCHNARCTEACGVIDPARIIRSLYFDEAVVTNELRGQSPCKDCEGRCEKA